MAGVFGLKRAYNKQRVDNWPESANYGYFAGGFGPSFSAIVDRIDFFNETTSAPGNDLPQARVALAGVFNSNYGYFAGGLAPPTTDLVNRIDLSNETFSSPGNDLPDSRYDLMSVSTPNYGYFAGGLAPALSNLVEKMDFYSETFSLPGNNLTQARKKAGAVSTPNYGYFAGGGTPGDTPSVSSIIDRLDFSSETIAGPPIHGANLDAARSSIASVFNSNYGYFAGGEAPPYVDTIERIDFLNETVSQPGNNLSSPRSNRGGVFNLNYGYFGGGIPATTGIDKIDFSTETISPEVSELTVPRQAMATISAGKRINAKGFKKHRTDKIGNPISKKNAYFAGGYASSDSSVVVDRMDYGSETVTNLTECALPTKTAYLISVVSENNYGYSAGGYAPPQTRTNLISRIDFSNETQSLPGKNLSLARSVWSSTYNNNYGYFAGGYTGSSYSDVVDRIDFSNETISPPGNNIPKGLDSGSNGIISTSYYGYFAGGAESGFTNANQCVTYRLDFTTETFGNLSTGDVMSVKRDRLGSHASSDYGYLVGGDEPSVLSTIDRLDFSNEVLTLYPTAILPSPGKMLFATTGNKSYAYYAGGYTTNDIDRMDYSTETVGDIPSDLSQSRYGVTGLS